MNRSIELITDESERLSLAELNLRAGRKAKASTAFNSALSYFTLGTEVLISSAWKTHYDLTFNLYKERVEAEYLNGHYETSEELINQVLKKVRTDVEKAEIYSLLILQNITIAKYREAIQTGRKALALLGVELPETDLDTVFWSELEKVRKNLGDREISSLAAEPEMTDPEKQVAMKLQFYLGPLLYLSNYKLWRINYLNAVNLTLKYGVVQESTAAYTGYGMVLCFELQEYKTAYEFGSLGLKISERFNSIYNKSSACYVIASFLSPWVRHMKHSLAFYDEGYKAGLESGNLLWVAYIIWAKTMILYYQGRNLKQIREESANFLQLAQKTKNQVAIDGILAYRLGILNLQGETSDKFSYHDDEMSETEYLEHCRNHESYIAISNFLIVKSMTLYLYGQPARALSCTLEAEKLLDCGRGLIQVAAHNFYHSLILTALYRQVSAEQQEQYREQLKTNQRQMKIWVDSCPENFEHMYLLVEAEISRITGKHYETIELYDRAVMSTQKNDFVQNEALANELSAKFRLERGEQDFASFYMKKAHGSYRLWGAKRKVEDLETRYRNLGILE